MLILLLTLITYTPEKWDLELCSGNIENFYDCTKLTNKVYETMGWCMDAQKKVGRVPENKTVVCWRKQ